jgi:hypothetical protein
MKRTTLLAAITLLAFIIPAYAADGGVSISIGQPGFYGRIDIGNYPPPQLIYRYPVIVEKTPVYGAPVYLRVPPEHAKHWKRHCHEYAACGERVYFVQDSWYEREYVPRYQEQHRHRQDFNGKHDDRGEGRRGDQGGDRHDDHRGNGRGRGD